MARGSTCAIYRSMAATLRVGVLISGRGSNLQALIEACAAPGFPARIVHVLSNKADAGGLEKAQAAGIATTVLRHRDFDSREAFDAAMSEHLRAAGVDMVCLAGFMRLLSDSFVTAWKDRLINIHPSLLPAFKGLHVHERVLEAGVKITGCTVHFVRTEMDSGPVIAQAAVPVAEDDDADSLAARVLTEEHRIYPLALRLLAEGRVRLAGERAVIDRACPPGQALISPSG